MSVFVIILSLWLSKTRFIMCISPSVSVSLHSSSLSLYHSHLSEPGVCYIVTMAFVECSLSHITHSLAYSGAMLQYCM